MKLHLLDYMPYRSIQWPIGERWGSQIFYSIRSQTKPMVLEWIVKSLTMRLQWLEPMTGLWYHLSNCIPYRSIQRPIGEGWGVWIFYNIRSQTKPIGIGANCEIPHNIADDKPSNYNSFTRQKQVLTMAFVHHRKYLVIQLPRMKLNCRWQTK